MSNADANSPKTETPEGLAKRFFALTVIGVVVYVAVVIALISTVD